MSIENNKSRKYNLIRNFCLLGAFIFVASINLNFNKAKKESPMKKTHIKRFKHTSKLQAPFNVQIKSEKEKIESGDTFELTGYIQSQQSMNQVKFKWVIPDGIEVINGEVEPIVSEIPVNQTIEFKLTLKSNAETNKIIHFMAESKTNESVFTNSSQFHTKAQENILTANEDLSIRTKNYKPSR